MPGCFNLYSSDQKGISGSDSRAIPGFLTSSTSSTTKLGWILAEFWDENIQTENGKRPPAIGYPVAKMFWPIWVLRPKVSTPIWSTRIFVEPYHLLQQLRSNPTSLFIITADVKIVTPIPDNYQEESKESQDGSLSAWGVGLVAFEMGLPTSTMIQ